MGSKVRVTIAVVTYRRVSKWISLMYNLKSVLENVPKEIDLEFLFIEDSKSPNHIVNSKFLISKTILGEKYFRYIKGSDNLGESRDIAINFLAKCTQSSRIPEWVGFIDDDDRYAPHIFEVLYDGLRLDNPLHPSIINFGMGSNFHYLDNPYIGYPERKNRLRYFDDKRFMGCMPSCANFVRLSEWVRSGLSYGKNPPSEESSSLMLFTFYSTNVCHIGLELMRRNRSGESLVNSMAKYSYEVIFNNINTHVQNLINNCKTTDDLKYIYKRFKYNYGSYFKYHGSKFVDDVFNEIESKNKELI